MRHLWRRTGQLIMNATLELDVQTIDLEDLQWQRAAKKECIAFGDHGHDTEYKNGHIVCFNCGGQL